MILRKNVLSHIPSGPTSSTQSFPEFTQEIFDEGAWEEYYTQTFPQKLTPKLSLLQDPFSW